MEGVASAEQRIEERLSIRLASTSSRMIEQAATNSAALNEMAAALAAESRVAAADAATGAAEAVSRRLYGQIEGRLQRHVEDAARATLDEALERVRADGAALLEAERTSFIAEARETRAKLGELATDIERREQRRDLKLARAETSRRVKKALSKVEDEARRIEARNQEWLTEARDDLKRVASEASAQFQAGEGEAGERVADALRRVEETVATIEESKSRIAELERRATAAEQNATRSAELARNAYELEARMREALNMEAAAAEQISLAERRLIDFVVTR
jgi:hypothetical protein